MSLPVVLAEAPAAAVAPIACDSVSFQYGDGRWANRDISLEIVRGEIFCLLGPNGAGKTTLLKQLVGQLRPASGRVRLMGIDVAQRRRDTIRYLGVIPQDVGLFEALTVERHLAHFAALKALPRKSRASAVASLLAECALEPLARRRVHALSMGERRRLLVALALLGDPPILVLDEPTVGLDPIVRRNVWNILRRRRAAGTTIFLTTHYLDEAEQLADRLAILEEGRVLVCGTQSELYRRVGRTVKVTELDRDTRHAICREYFDTVEQASRYVAERRVRDFLIGQVTLEDVYLRLLGHPLA